MIKIGNTMKHPTEEVKNTNKTSVKSGGQKHKKENNYAASSSLPQGEIDWDSFKFPPPPNEDGEEDKDDDVHYTDGTLSHFTSPKKVNTWNLDVGGMFIIHPTQRKKIDLTKVNTKRKLIQLVNLIKDEKNTDAKALYISIDKACRYAWSMTLPETIAYSPDQFSWPIDLKIDEVHDDD